MGGRMKTTGEGRMSTLYSFFGGKKKVTPAEVAAPARKSLRLPDAFVVAQQAAQRNGAVPIDDYMALHATASKLEEEVLSYRNAGTMQDMRDDLTLRTRRLKSSLALLLLALFQFVLTAGIFVCFVVLGSFYYFEVEPYRTKMDLTFRHIGELLGGLSPESVRQAGQHLESAMGKPRRLQR